VQTAETDTCFYVLRDDGIIQQTVKPNCRQDVPDAEKNMEVFFSLAGGEKRRLLVDLRKSGPTGPGVREYYAKQAVHLIASAMIVEGSLSEMIGNFFITLNRPPAPTRLFNNEASAVAWLKLQK
jgi:hypothetical protein